MICLLECAKCNKNNYKLGMINDNKDDLFRDLPPLVPIDKKRLKVQEVVPKSANPTKVKDDLEPFVQEIGLNILETNITQSR